MRMTLVTFAVRRMWSRKLVIGTSATAVFLASVLLTALPLYVSGLRRAASADSLAHIGSGAEIITVAVNPSPLSAPQLNAQSIQIKNAAAVLQPLAFSLVNGLRSAPLNLSRKMGQPGGWQSLTSSGFYETLDGWQGNVRFIAGHSPIATGPAFGTGTPIQIAVPAATGAALGISPGDELRIQRYDSRPIDLDLVVAGLFNPEAPEGEYWAGNASMLLTPPPSSPGELPPLVALVPQATALALNTALTGSEGTGWWMLNVDPTSIVAQNPGTLLSKLKFFASNVQADLPNSVVSSPLNNVLESVPGRYELASVPVILMASLLAALAIGLASFVAGSMLADTGPDFTRLHGRGANAWQSVRAQLPALALICAIPTVLANVCAFALITFAFRHAAETPTLNRLIGSVDSTTSLLIWSSLAFVVSAAPFIGAVAITSARRRSNHEHSRSRYGSPPWFQRYSLDLGVVVAAGLILWELHRRGGFLSVGAHGNGVLLTTYFAGPVLAVLGAALLALRAVPRLLGWAAGRVSKTSVSTGMVAVLNLARDPFSHAWPLLILWLAVSTATIGATVGTSLTKASHDRAWYGTGSAVHVSGLLSPNRDAPDYELVVGSVSGVGQVAAGWRTEGSVGTTQTAPTFSLLSIQPTRFAQVAWFRKDFATQSLSGLMTDLKASSTLQSPIVLPLDAKAISIDLTEDPTVNGTDLWVRVEDRAGQFLTLPLSQTELGPSRGTYQAKIPTSLQPPVRISAFLAYQAGVKSSEQLPEVTFSFHQAFTISAAGVMRPINAFNDPSVWHALPSSGGFDSQIAVGGFQTDGSKTTDQRLLRLDLGHGSDSGIRGMFASNDASVVPAVFSSSLLRATGAKPGEVVVTQVEGRFVPLQVAAATDLFPTLDPGPPGFAVANLSLLESYLLLRGPLSSGPAELFLSVTNDVLASAVATRVSNALPTGAIVQTANARQQKSLIDPLVSAGWGDVSRFTLVFAALAASIGLAVYLSIHAKKTLYHAALLRALGTSRLGWMAALSGEHLLLPALGAFLGIGSGLVITRALVTTLAPTSALGSLPPAILVTSWTTLLPLVVVPLISAAIVFAVWMWRSSKKSISQILRETPIESAQ